jgi:hypothetical protein
MTTKEIKEVIGNAIATALQQLPENEWLKIEYPKVFRTYKPSHPVGEFVIFVNQAKYGNSKNANSIVQDKDLRISIFVIVKVTDQGKRPEEYIDFLDSILTGIRILSNRADKLVYPESFEFMDEENGYWSYECIYVVPTVNIQTNNFQ